MSVAFIFPGQGSSRSACWPAWRRSPRLPRCWATADEVLGEPISRLIAEGPAEELALTTNTQPAMLLAGLGCLAAWRSAGGFEPDFVAGHSLGEYTALAAAGAIDARPPVAGAPARAGDAGGRAGRRRRHGGHPRPVRRPGRAGVRAGPRRPGNCGEVVDPANFNAPSQVVIAGHKGAVDRACAAAKALGAKRAVLLPVSAPFHSPLLAPAGAQLQRALADVALRAPRIPLVNNIDVAVETDPARIKDALVRQAYGPVRWVEVVQALAARGVDHFIEFGPGKVLSGLVKRIAPAARIDAVHDAASLEQTLEQTLELRK